MKRLIFAAVVAAGLGAPAVAQPINESLVECAVLVDRMLGDDVPAAGSNPQVDFWVSFEVALRTSSIERSGQAYWDDTSVLKQAVWSQRWNGQPPEHPDNVDEAMEWMDYCLSLADHLQL